MIFFKKDRKNDLLKKIAKINATFLHTFFLKKCKDVQDHLPNLDRPIFKGLG